MGIIRDEDRKARQDYLDAADSEEQRRIIAAHEELDRLLPQILEKICDSAREWLRVRGVAEFGQTSLPSAVMPIWDDLETAEKIKAKMREIEPATASVLVEWGPRSSVDRECDVVVRFNPPLN